MLESLHLEICFMNTRPQDADNLHSTFVWRTDAAPNEKNEHVSADSEEAFDAVTESENMKVEQFCQGN